VIDGDYLDMELSTDSSLSTAKKLIVLDTNFLFVPILYGIDIESQLEIILNTPYEIVVLSPTFDELQKKMKNTKKLKVKKMISFAVEFAKKFKTINLKSVEKVDFDNILLSFAEKNKNRCIVATNDASLRKKLKAKNIPVIFVRARKKLALDGYY